MFFALRETLGAAWTLRLVERFDLLATRRGWPVRLTFQGMRIQEEPEDSRWQADTGRAMEALDEEICFIILAKEAWLGTFFCLN